MGDPHALTTQDINKEIVDLRVIHTQKNKAELRVNILRPYYLNNTKTTSCVDKKHYFLPFVVLNSLMGDPHWSNKAAIKGLLILRVRWSVAF